MIWVIDDEAPMRSLLQDFLVTQGYEVRGFSSAVDALLALESPEVPRAIVCHTTLRPMNGFNFLIVAHGEHPNLPILLFTGEGSPEERQEATRLNAAAYLIKPFPLSYLKEQIEQALLPLPSVPFKAKA